MRDVRISKLSDLKSAFNSPDDNLHFFRLIKRSIGTVFGPVELAEPSIQHSAQTLRWRALSEGDLIPFPELSQRDQERIGASLQEAFKIFQDKIRLFKDIPADFQSKVMEIPGTDSILVAKSSVDERIVITDWGFLADRFDRTPGILRSIFPAQELSILVRLLTPTGMAVAGKTVEMSSDTGKMRDVSDSNGYVRLGSLARSRTFHLESKEGVFPGISFTSDGRQEYIVEVPKSVNLQVRVRTSAYDPVPNFPLGFFTTQLGKREYVTGPNGVATIIYPESNGEYQLIGVEGNVLLSSALPREDSEVEIVIDAPVLDMEPKEVLEDVEEVTPLPRHPDVVEIRLTNRNGSPLAGVEIGVKGIYNQFQSSAITDGSGIAYVSGIPINSDYTVAFNHRQMAWTEKFHHKAGIDRHTFQVKTILPWLWWILIFILLLLLFLCMSGRLCEIIGSWGSRPASIVEAPSNPPSNMQPCNSQVSSGGEGVTENVHFMGSTSGNVTINYNTKNVPDKIEVMYMEKVIASTESIAGNDNGFVGEANNAGCCGKLNFPFASNGEEFVTVRVTGLGSTEWSYEIDCPR